MEKGCTNYTGSRRSEIYYPSYLLRSSDNEEFLQVIDDKKSVMKHYSQLGKHFAEIKDYRTAEQLFLDVHMYEEAIAMYTHAGNDP